MGTNAARDSGQIGMRLEFRTGRSQRRHGRGATTEASALSTERLVTLWLYNQNVPSVKKLRASGSVSGSF